MNWFRSVRRKALDSFRQGRAALQRDDFDLAVCWFSEAIRLDPRLEAGYRGRGLAYLKKGEHRLAIADFSEVIRLRPTDADSYFYRSFCYNGQGDAGRERSDYRTALTLEPGVEARLLDQKHCDRGIAMVNTHQTNEKITMR